MEIKILIKEELEKLSQKPFEENTAVISISRTGGEQVRLINQPRFLLHTSFNDADYDIFYDEVTEMPTDKERLAIEKKYGMITDMQAAEIALFYRENAKRIDRLICQDESGESRSSAVAAAITEFENKDGINIFSADDYYPNKIIFRKVFKALGSLCFNKDEERFMKLRFGVDNGTCLSLEQISEEMNLDCDQVKLLEKNTVSKAKRIEKVQEKLFRANKFISTAKAVVVGHAVGDALGVPVEFEARAVLDENPVTDMRGYGTYDMPKGAWSDDTSMSLCALEIVGGGKINFDLVMENFVKWYHKDEYTPTGKTFDVGNTCSIAIENYFVGKKSWSECGMTNEGSNGNGSLMRIHPFVLHTYRLDTNVKTKIRIVEMASALTHAHERSRVGCGIYAFVLWELIEKPCKESVVAGLKKADEYYKSNAEFDRYKRVFSFSDVEVVNCVQRNTIKSSGYIVDSLEAAIWSVMTTSSYKECVLKAVNLGDDTDTVAAIAGGLAGALYGYDAIPEEWKDALLRRGYIEYLCYKAFS